VGGLVEERGGAAVDERVDVGGVLGPDDEVGAGGAAGVDVG
jgi:hypothetical protein